MLEEDCTDCPHPFPKEVEKSLLNLGASPLRVGPNSPPPAQVRDSSLEVIRITVKQSLTAWRTHPGEHSLAASEICFPSLGELIRVTEPQI